MELNFKDTKSENLFKEVEKLDLKQPEIEDDLFEPEDVVPLKSKQDIKTIPKNDNIKKEVELSHKISISTEQLKRIESKQNAILEILECVPLPTVKQIDLNDTIKSDIDNLKLNLNLFNKKLIILSTSSTNKR